MIQFSAQHITGDTLAITGLATWAALLCLLFGRWLK